MAGLKRTVTLLVQDSFLPQPAEGRVLHVGTLVDESSSYWGRGICSVFFAVVHTHPYCGAEGTWLRIWPLHVPPKALSR